MTSSGQYLRILTVDPGQSDIARTGVKMAANRFAALSEQELSSIIESKDSKNTKVATKHAVKLFKEYLFEKSMEVDFESFSVSELSTNLRTFYAELRTTGGEMYKRSSLQAVRSGLNR